MDEELKDIIKKRIRCMINTGLEKRKGVKMIKRDYSISDNDLNDLWLTCKREIRMTK